ncbi:MAG TPA: nuclear transport factor 2 family protein [Gammaproteobacteria bacterium]
MAAPLSDLERLTIRVALEDLNTAFCHHLDHNEVDALLELFVDDVYYTHGSRVSRGKAELEEVFRNRSATQTRTARHLYSGLKLDIESATRARGTSVCMTFAAYGEPPLSPAIPTLVADFVDQYVRGDDGRWRFKELHIHRIFVAPDNAGPIGQKR